MQVSEIMTDDVRVLSPNDSILKAACKMRDAGIGSFPVVSGDKPIGYVTDRDLVVRGLAAGLATRISSTSHVEECRLLLRKLPRGRRAQREQIRRLPVLMEDGRLCGIISLGDIATRGSETLPRKH